MDFILEIEDFGSLATICTLEKINLAINWQTSYSEIVLIQNVVSNAMKQKHTFEKMLENKLPIKYEMTHIQEHFLSEYKDFICIAYYSVL